MKTNIELSRWVRSGSARAACLWALAAVLACTDSSTSGPLEGPPRAAGTQEQAALQTDLTATRTLSGGVYAYEATLPPASVVGTISQTLEAQWDTAHQGIRQPPIYPQGWSLDYYAGGTRLPGEPATAGQWAQVSRVVATGALNVEALDGERQALISNVTAPLRIVASSFSGGSAGDGWDVFFDPDYTRVFNIHHHNSPASVMCRKLSDSSTCPGFPINLTQTSFRSTGRIDAASNKLWQPTVTFDAKLGWDCVDLTTAARCATPTVVSANAALDNTYNNHTDPVVIGRKMYALGYSAGITRITCLDMATGAECTGKELPQNGLFGYAGITEVGTRIYVLPGNNLNLDCYESTTWARCPGSWPQPASEGPVWAVRSGDGVVRNVCANKQCFALDGSAHTLPPNFIAYLTAQSVQTVLGNASSRGNKAAWSIGGRTTCWNMATDALCAPAFPVTVPTIYATVLDPEDPDCMWTNGDDGIIRNFRISTGEPGCGGGPARITFKAEASVPRLSCDPASRVFQYKSFKLITPSPAQYTSAKLTVRDSNGVPIAGWINRPINPANPTVDLTSLTPAQVGSTPSFDVYAEGLTDTSVVPEGEFRVTTGAPPQLCWNLSLPAALCPTTAGLASDSSNPQVAAVTAKGSFSTSSGTQSFTDQVLNTRIDPTRDNCGTRLLATVVSLTDGQPVSGATVFLLDSAGNPVRDANNQPVSSVSAADGTLEFLVWPAGYKLQMTGNAQVSPVLTNVTAGGSGMTVAAGNTVVSNLVTTQVSQASHVTITVAAAAGSGGHEGPCAPVITSPPGGTVVYDRVTPLTGTAEAGDTVTVKANGQTVCTVVADSQGQWSCSAELPVGTSTLVATSQDSAGNSSGSSSGVLITRREGIGPPVITGPPARVQSGDVTVTGTSEPNADITVKDEQGNTVCTAKADDMGAWQCDATLLPGEHRLTADAEWRGFQSTSQPHDTRVLDEAWFQGSGCTSAGSAQPAWMMVLALGGLVVLRRRRASAVLR